MLCKCRGCTWQEVLMFVAGLLVMCGLFSLLLLVLHSVLSVMFWAFGYDWAGLP